MSKNQVDGKPIAEPNPLNDKGRSIGNYILGKTIGEGTFGKVKLGTHSLTGEKVAIKVLQKSRIIDVADVQRVSRQIHILKLIRHPNIIQLYEIIQTQKQLFLVMEYVSDGELFDYIVKKKKIKQPEACEFLQQILTGVEYLHKLNIVHRDLKPQNLLIDFNKRIKLVDFGLSNTYKKNQLLKTACGSPCYAAPQMIAGKKYEGLNVDIWSCGVILFAMICGYLPFQDPNTSCLYKKILAGDYVIPKFVSADAKDLIKGILTTDPQKRLTLKDIKSHRWFTQVKPLTQCEGIIVGYHRIPVDNVILNNLKDYEFDIQASKKCLESNRHNHLTTTYYLLLKKNLKNGLNSQADICSQTFNKNLIQPIPKKKDKEKEKKDDFFADQLDFQGQGNRKRKITSQIGKRGSNLTAQTTVPSISNKPTNSTLDGIIQNLPTVNDTKQSLRKTINRFNFKQKKATIDVDLYDFQDFGNAKIKTTRQKQKTQNNPHVNKDNLNHHIFNRTNIIFKPRYGSISSRQQNPNTSIQVNRRISVREKDLNKTFRITKNTFDRKDPYESLDVKINRKKNRAFLIKKFEDQQSIALRNVLNNVSYKRSTNNNFY